MSSNCLSEMPAKAGHSKYQRHKLIVEHQKRRAAKLQRIAGLRALLQTHEQAGNTDEVKRLITKIRLTKQELRYMTD